MFCTKCGKEIQKEWSVCPNCGQAVGNNRNMDEKVMPVYESQTGTHEVKKIGFWSTGRLVLGILSCVVCAVVLLQSCAVGMLNTLDGTGGVDGTAGFMLAISILIAGIAGISTRNNQKKTGAIVSCVFYWIGTFFSLAGSEAYGDLPIWGMVSFIFGCVFLIAAIKTK